MLLNPTRTNTFGIDDILGHKLIALRPFERDGERQDFETKLISQKMQSLPLPNFAVWYVTLQKALRSETPSTQQSRHDPYVLWPVQVTSALHQVRHTELL